MQKITSTQPYLDADKVVSPLEVLRRTLTAAETNNMNWTETIMIKA